MSVDSESKETGSWSSPRGPLRLAVFTGQYFWFDGQHYSTDEAFVEFVNSFHTYFDRIVFCDSVVEERKTQPYVLDPKFAEVCAFPYFNLHSLWKAIPIVFPKIYCTIRKNINNWDIVWLHAPHPLSLLFVCICRMVNKPYFFFVRQNLKDYVRLRFFGVKLPVAVSLARMLECVLRHLSRNTVTFVVGRELFDTYSQSGRRVHEAIVSLVSEKCIANLGSRRKRDRTGPVRLLSVGRLDPEKGISCLIQAIEGLVRGGKKNVILRIAGSGSEEKRLQEKVRRLGLSDHVRFLGYVPHGDELFALYRDSDIFVLPSLTEGFPQTLLEAMACGVPVVATGVGGIPDLIKDGENGLLVAPACPRKICEAIKRLISDEKVRERLVKNGFACAKNHTMEAERRRILGQIEQLVAI
jgi:glycosyltransferase involved in cell wall biosynthesis